MHVCIRKIRFLTQLSLIENHKIIYTGELAMKDWNVKSQSFRVGSVEATTKNKLLFDLKAKYLHVADT